MSDKHTNKQRKSFANKMLFALLLSAVIVFLLHVILKYISVVMFAEQHGSFYELSARLDVNDENSVPQWFSQLLFLGVGLSAFFAAYLSKERVTKLFWGTIGIISVLLSLDDVATLHEYILQGIHNKLFQDTVSSFFVNAWLVVLPFILLIGAGLSWWAWKVLPKRTMILVILGGLIYVLGKILMDSLSNNVDDLFMDRGIMQGLEKIFQYSGISVVLYGIVDYIERKHGEAITRSIRQLK